MPVKIILWKNLANLAEDLRLHKLVIFSIGSSYKPIGMPSGGDCREIYKF